MTDSTKSAIQSKRPPPINSNQELKEILSNEITVDKIDPEAINDISKEFCKFGIEVPGQVVIPLTRSSGDDSVLTELKEKFIKLQLEYKRIKWV